MSIKILVTDDDPSSTRLIEYILKQRGYQVVTAQNGLEGLKKAQTEDPDLLVLDVMLPGMDGFEVCRRLRAEDKTAQLPILVLSGKAQEIDKATAFKMGADDYITKPATPTEIISKIESLLARRTAANSKTVAFMSPQAKVGTTTTAVNVAIALSQMGKRVVVIDLCPYDGSISQCLGLEPQDSLRLTETPKDSVKPDDMESAIFVHQTGIRVIRVLETSSAESILPNAIDSLFNRLGGVTNYFLVDLPFQPGNLTRIFLERCDFAIVVSDYSIAALASVTSTVTILNFLGISSERVGAVVVDRKGTFPQMALTTIKPYVDANLGIRLLGTIPYNNLSLESSSNGLPIIISSPSCPMACSVKELAQQIIAQQQTQKYSSSIVVKRR